MQGSRTNSRNGTSSDPAEFLDEFKKGSRCQRKKALVKSIYIISFMLTAKVSRINLHRIDGFFTAAPDRIASHICK